MSQSASHQSTGASGDDDAAMYDGPLPHASHGDNGAEMTAAAAAAAAAPPAAAAAAAPAVPALQHSASDPSTAALPAATPAPTPAVPVPAPAPVPQSAAAAAAALLAADPALAARVAAYRQSCLSILAQYQTHHLIPHSGKVVIFDSQLVVKHAFDGMVHHDLTCAPVWDSWKKKYVGLLSVSDFLDILMSTYAAEDKSMFDNLSNARICDWAEYKKQRGTSINRLLCISPEATLHEAVRQLLNYRVHRLCVVQLALADTVLRIITNHGILRFLRNNAPLHLASAVTIRQLGIGVFHNLLTLTFQTPVIKALELLSAYKVSSIPIVDEQMRPVDVYTRSDVRYLALDQTWTNLDMTIEEALSKHRRGRALPLCSRDDSIHTVSGLLVSSMRHSLICVKPDGTIEGVVSLTDIFSFLLNTNAPAAESRIAALMQDYAQFEAAEASRLSAEAAAANEGGTAPLSAKSSLQVEERLKQQSFLAEHGVGGADTDVDAMMLGDVGIVHDEQLSPAAIQSAIAAGTASALRMPHHRGFPASGPASASHGSTGPFPGSSMSPDIRPSQPDDLIPQDMDFLG